MIISKPKRGTLFSLTVFTLLGLSVLIFTIQIVLTIPDPVWYQYLIIAVLTPLVVLIGGKLTWGYKIVRVGKGYIEIYYLFRLKKKKYNLKQITQWGESTVKTPSGLFRELQIIFEDRNKLKLSLQESTYYEPILKYLQKKIAKKKVGNA